MMPPALLLFLKIALAIQGIFWFLANFRIFFCFCEKHHWNFNRARSELYMDLGNINILITLILLINEHGASFHLSVSSSISFNRVL